MKILIFLPLLIFAKIVSSESDFKPVKVDVPLKPYNENAVEEVKSKRGSKIYNGKAAVDGQFPFVNEINHFLTDNSYALCTGSFITSSWVIASFHCVRHDDTAWHPIYIKYGTASRSSSNRKTIGVDSYVWWNYADTQVDLVVLHTHEPVQLNQNVGIAQLPPLSMENFNFEGWTVYQAGYGAFKDLQYHQIKINTINVGCPWAGSDGLNQFNICALPVVAESGAEGGDSGSPFFYYDNGQPTLAGIYWGGGGDKRWHMAIKVTSFIRSISQITGASLRN